MAQLKRAHRGIRAARLAQQGVWVAEESRDALWQLVSNLNTAFCHPLTYLAPLPRPVDQSRSGKDFVTHLLRYNGKSTGSFAVTRITQGPIVC